MDENNALNGDLSLIGLNINRTLSKLMEDNHVSMSVLYRNTGIAIPTIKRLLCDPSTNPTITTLLPIARFFGVSLTQLIGDEPLPLKASGYVVNKTHWLKVPIISWDHLISWKISEKDVPVSAHILVDIDVGDNPIALNVEEDDWPTLPKGSILIINTDLIPEHKDYAIVYKRGQNNPTLKQVLMDDEKIYLKPMNAYFSPKVCDNNYIFLGVLIQVRKDLKV